VVPRLGANDDKILDLNIAGDLPALPNLTELAKSADPRAMAVGQAEFGAQTATIWQVGGQRILGAVLVNTGIPQGDTYDAAIAAIGLDPAALDVITILREAMGGTVDRLTEKALKQAFSEGIGVAADMLGVVPVAGWIAKAIIDAGVAIYRLVRLVQEGKEPPETTYERATFDPGLDRYMAQDVIGTTRHSVDWNSLFSPPAIGSSRGYVDAVGFQRLEDGLRMTITGMSEHYSDGWTGYIPGSNNVTAQLEIITMEPGSTNLQVYDTGRLFPSLRNMSTMAWTAVTRNSPQMYCVDANDLIRRWESYLGQIRDAIQSTGRLTTDQKRVVVRKLKSIYGWGSFNSRTPVGEWDAYGLDRSVPIAMLRTLRARQLGYLDTTTIAYVDESFEAFRTDLEARDKLRTNLPLLVKHPARCTLDMKNVRNPDYAKALRDSGVGTPRCLQLGLAAAGPFGKRPSLPAFPANPAGSAGNGTTTGAGIAVAALAAIALLAGRR
jgi:hypothetical protein